LTLSGIGRLGKGEGTREGRKGRERREEEKGEEDRSRGRVMILSLPFPLPPESAVKRIERRAELKETNDQFHEP
jgi:hypothetical protein